MKRHIAVHILFVLLIALTICSNLQALQGVRVAVSGLTAASPGGAMLTSRHPGMFLGVTILLELIVCLRLRGRGDRQSVADVGCLLFFALLVWELIATTLRAGHPILCPPPEAVFDVFRSQWKLMLRGMGSSLQLLGAGFAIALPLSLVLGALAGWNRRFRGVTVPVARAMAPVPAIIYAPYIIAIMPTFRSAAAMVIVLGIFWPAFLQTVNRVLAMDREILDSARMLSLSSAEMIFQVLIPWMLPGVVVGLRVTLSTSFMLLILAEMMGATSGLGYFIKNFADYANYTNVLAGIILVGCVVNVLNLIPALLERYMKCWR